MELTYHWGGDVLIPDLELEDGSNYQIGKYGRMRQRYLFENYHAMYTHLVLTEKLWKHLEEVDMEYNDMMDMLTVRMAEREGVTEHLKSVDQLGWVRKMNNIRSRAEEVVLHDLIYSKNKAGIVMVPALSYHIYENGAIGCYYHSH